MIKTGKVTGRRIGTNREGTHDVLILQVQITDPDDVQSIEVTSPAGLETSPADGARVFIAAAGDAWKLVLSVDDFTDREGAEGEVILYSIAGGARAARLHLTASGELVLNKGTDFAVAYEELKAKLDALQAALNAHGHTGVTVGAGVTGAPVAPFDVDITAAKVPTVRFP